MAMGGWPIPFRFGKSALIFLCNTKNVYAPRLATFEGRAFDEVWTAVSHGFRICARKQEKKSSTSGILDYPSFENREG